MATQSIAVSGDGPLYHMWFSNGMSHFPRVTFYDRGASTTAFRKAEAKLGESGYLNKEGREAAKRIAENIKNPPKSTVSVVLTGSIQDGTVTVTCQNGNQRKFKVRLTGIEDKDLDQGFYQVNAAVARCLAAPAQGEKKDAAPGNA